MSEVVLRGEIWVPLRLKRRGGSICGRESSRVEVVSSGDMNSCRLRRSLWVFVASILVGAEEKFVVIGSFCAVGVVEVENSVKGAGEKG
jgi:hypothetical protein